MSTSTVVAATPPASLASVDATLLGSALDLELSLLRLIVDRASAQHRRTRYHRRLRMALRRIGEGRYHLHAMAAILGRCSHERVRLSSEFARRRRRLLGSSGEERWVAISDDAPRRPRDPGGRDTFSPPADDGTLADLTSWLRLSVDRSIPESVSLLHFAADALYAEIGRGFFLPLTTASLACVARVRSILLSMGRMAVEESVYTGAVAREVLSAVTSAGGDGVDYSKISHSIPWLGGYGSLERVVVKDCGDLTMADVRRFAEVAPDDSTPPPSSSSPSPPSPSSTGTKKRKERRGVEDGSSSPKRMEDVSPSGSVHERGEEDEYEEGVGATRPETASSSGMGGRDNDDDDDMGLRVDGTVEEEVTPPSGDEHDRASLERSLFSTAGKKRKKKRGSSPIGGGADRGLEASASAAPAPGSSPTSDVDGVIPPYDAGEDGGGGDDAAAVVEGERRRQKKKRRKKEEEVAKVAAKEAKTKSMKKKKKSKKKSGASVVDDIFSGLC